MKSHCYLIAAVIHALAASVCAQLDFALISTAVHLLRMRHYLLICPTKQLSHRQLVTGDATAWSITTPQRVRERHLRHNGMVVCADTPAQHKKDAAKMMQDFSRQARSHAWLVTGSRIDDIKPELQMLQVDEQVFFLNDRTLTLSEYYQINGQKVDRVLGTLQRDANGGKKARYARWEKRNFLERRSNFHGIRLKGVNERQPPYMEFPIATNSSGGNGSDLLSLASVPQRGLFRDLLLFMQADLNFTTEVFVRRDRKWGNVDASTGRWVGMVESLMSGQADIITTSLTVALERSEVVSYLPMMSQETFAIVIKRVDEGEELAWSVFLHPFTTKLWAVVLAVPFAALLVLKGLQAYYRSAGQGQDDDDDGIWKDFVGHYWMMFGSNLGGAPCSLQYDDKLSLQIVLFHTFLIGNIVFMSYNAFLTSELAVREIKMPFSSLEELLPTKYGLMVKDNGITADSFKNAKDGILKEIFKQKMEANPSQSFLPNEGAALIALNQSSSKAYYGIKESIVTFPEYKCQLENPWTSMYPNHLAMAVPKDSPYYPFLHFNVIKQYEMGTLGVLEKRWKQPWPDCSGNENLSLGFEKLVSLFALLVASSVAASALFAQEWLAVRCKSTSPQHVTDYNVVINDKIKYKFST